MKIICTGLPKTGTKSMCAALRILGYKVYDYEEQCWFMGDELATILNEGCKNVDIRRIFEDVDAVTDLPVCLIWELVFREFPEVKVVHCERNTDDEWMKSLIKQCDVLRNNLTLQTLFTFTYTGRKLSNLVCDSFMLGWCTKKKPWKLHALNEDIAKLRYREHNSHVKQTVPQEQLLQFKVGDGWEPLCKFLDVPIPEQKFPYLNKKGDIVNRIISESLIYRRIKNEFYFVVTVMVIFTSYVLYNIF